MFGQLRTVIRDTIKKLTSWRAPDTARRTRRQGRPAALRACAVPAAHIRDHGVRPLPHAARYVLRLGRGARRKTRPGHDRNESAVRRFRFGGTSGQADAEAMFVLCGILFLALLFALCALHDVASCFGSLGNLNPACAAVGMVAIVRKDWTGKPIRVDGQWRTRYAACTMSGFHPCARSRAAAIRMAQVHSRAGGPVVCVAAYLTQVVDGGGPTGVYFMNHVAKLDQSDSDISRDLKILYLPSEGA